MYRSWVGYFARAHVHCRYSPFPYLINCWTDCAEISYMVRDPIARRFTEVDDVVQLHVRTPFSYLWKG